MSSGSKRKIHGVDFSGAQDAGKKIWISSGRREDDKLIISDCQSAVEKFGEKDRDSTLEKLREFIADSGQSVFGLDFSFGVPKKLADTENWEDFIQSFDRHSDAKAMQETYSEQARKQTNGERAHLKRSTDEEMDASSPYGFITFRQTFHGIQDMLWPLIRNESVSVLPMQSAKADRPWVLEVYPAATLDQFGLCRKGYKEDTESSRKRRKRNLDGLFECLDGELEDDEIRETIIENSEGDALDSLVAAFATFRAVYDGPPVFDENSHPEGHIYV